MKQLIINDLYLLSLKDKKAKKVSFKSNINIITSSKTDGTKRGKSLICKSIYHTLGADCKFEGRWNINDKVFILSFSVDLQQYIILRSGSLFKIFDGNTYEKLFETINRTELSEFLRDIYDFSIELPNKDNILELTPPVFDYILNYIDQDKMNCTTLNSFERLTQYSNFKDLVLFAHFNVYNREYYSILKAIESLNAKLSDYENEKLMNQSLLVRLNKNLNNANYSTSIDHLEEELNQTKTEYSSIVEVLDKIKKSLINLKNEQLDLTNNISKLEKCKNESKKTLNKMLLNHECPYCHSEIINNFELQAFQYNAIEDVLLMKVELESSLLKINRKINIEEEKYKKQLDVLNQYQNKIHANTQEISDVLKFRGYIEVRESLVHDIGTVTSNIEECFSELTKYKNKKNKYSEKKKQINNKYHHLMMIDRNKFQLEEITENDIEKVTNTFKAGGSNMPVSTIIWYINLLKIKKEFNPDAIVFPVVIDSPNNAEIDDEKKQTHLEYIFDALGNDTQLIVSSLGFDKNQFSGRSFDNIIELKNDKYHLLSEEEYELNKEFLLKLI